jgi:hypothetical protein
MTAAARGARRPGSPGEAPPGDAWARHQLQAEWLIDRLVNAVRSTAARAREEVEDVWAEAEQLRRDGPTSG